MAPLNPTVISEAIAAPTGDERTGLSRRSLAKGAGWSVPVIATAIAAPAVSASVSCSACEGASGPPHCIISGVPGGTCTCGPGLMCVGTGPLGLVNICVGTDLLLSTCGNSRCYGVCLATGGALVSAINTFMLAVTSFVTAVGAIGGLVGLRTCVNQPGIPPNICVSPFNDGRLGALCTWSASCGNTTLIDIPLAIVTTAYNTMISVLSSLGVAVSPRCQDGLVCNDIASVAVGFKDPLPIIIDKSLGFTLGVGFCQCPPHTNTCGPDDTTPFPPRFTRPYPACTPRY